MLTLILALIFAAPEVPPVIGPMATPLHRLTTAPALPHPDLYHGEPGMCQPRDDRPWWWTPADPPTQLGALLLDTPTEAESKMVERLMDSCPHAYRAQIDPWEALALLRFEQDHGVPASEVGVLLGWRCYESGWRDGEKLYGDHGAALGVFQLHAPWAAVLVLGRPATSKRDWADAMRVDWRSDEWASAYAVLQAIERQLPRAAKACGPKIAWRVAEALVSRRMNGIDCKASTTHTRFADSLRAQ